jgi:MFS family permease
MGLGISVLVPTAFAMAGRLAAPAARARAIARTAVLGYMGFFLGPPVLGFVAELVGLRASYGLVAALLLAAIALQVRLARFDR